jgi:hypothetical protein
MAVHWYGKQDTDNDHEHARVEHCVRKKDIAAYLKIQKKEPQWLPFAFRGLMINVFQLLQLFLCNVLLR